MTANTEVLTGMVVPAATTRLDDIGGVDTDDRAAGADSQLERSIRRADWDLVPQAVEGMLRWDLVRQGELEQALDRWYDEGGGFSPDRPVKIAHESVSTIVEFPNYRNDIGAHDIKIGAKAFHCLGASPPDDHPHIYLQMSTVAEIRCPYCSTLYIFDGRLRADESEPVNCLYEDTLSCRRG